MIPLFVASYAARYLPRQPSFPEEFPHLKEPGPEAKMIRTQKKAGT
jgi:hypothetical protein